LSLLNDLSLLLNVDLGIILAANYVLGRHFVASDDPTAVGMQGHPHSIEDMTDGQVEERFYQ